MGILTPSFPFIAGTVCGVYIAQNYTIPNIKKLAYSTYYTAREIEQRYRKPPKAKEDQ